MKQISLSIRGVSPLLMHAFPMVPIEALEKKSPAEQAEYAAYRIPGDSRELYIPGTALQRALVGAGGFSKGKGRATLQKIVAACVAVSPEYLGLSTTEYIVDSRPVIVPATRGRVLRHRPRLDTWQTDATIDFDDNLITETQLRKIVDDCGRLVGLLDYRPANRGPYGRFMITKWEIAKLS